MVKRFDNRLCKFALHSTMFLLILNMRHTETSNCAIALHSTMFLLIRRWPWNCRSVRNSFTFHNVSINTDHQVFYLLRSYTFTFHNVSINTFYIVKNLFAQRSFTFHNVSINTRIKFSITGPKTTLHSTMFLLIPIAEYSVTSAIIFTFHNVSINTRLKMID